MKKKLFWKCYAVFAALLVILCASALIYVNGVLKEYEVSQPEKAVEAQIERIREAAAAGTLEQVMEFQELSQAEYDIDISDYKEYKEKIKQAKEFTYKVKTGSYSETEQQFSVLADGEAVAVVSLRSAGEEIKLAILTISDWQVDSVVPVMKLMNYNYTVELPKGFSVTINGTQLTDAKDLGNGWEAYAVETLYSEPEIKVYDSYGAEVVYDIVDNKVVPIVFTYHLRLPKSFTVYAGGKEQEGDKEQTEKVYSITTIHDTLELADAYGNHVEYRGGDSIYTYSYTMTLPDNFTVTVNGASAEEYIVGRTENEKYRYIKEYATLPGLTVYEMPDALAAPKTEITDNLGQTFEAQFDGYALEITGQTGAETPSADVLSPSEVLDIAKKWSLLMTGDLTGSQNGFGAMKPYLIQNSYLYNVAYKWVNGIDFTFTSSHTLEEPPFTGETVTNYVIYNENLFSCDVAFVKHMYLYKTEQYVTDEMNSTFYFFRYGEGDAARWVILDIQEIVSK